MRTLNSLQALPLVPLRLTSSFSLCLFLSLSLSLARSLSWTRTSHAALAVQTAVTLAPYSQLAGSGCAHCSAVAGSAAH